MLITARAGTQVATYDSQDAGEGLAIFFSQSGDDTCRYRLRIRAITTDGTWEVGEVYTSPPSATVVPGPLSRMVAGAVCPGAISWNVEVLAVNYPGAPVPPDETANIILASSRCFAQIGAQRVNERYKYIAGSGNQNVSIVAGQKIIGIAAIGLTGGGTVQIPNASGDTVLVPAGVGINLQPDGLLAPNSVISFNNVDFVIELTESA